MRDAEDVIRACEEATWFLEQAWRDLDHVRDGEDGSYFVDADSDANAQYLFERLVEEFQAIEGLARDKIAYMEYVSGRKVDADAGAGVGDAVAVGGNAEVQ